jgi:hypothetical protein
MELLSFIHNSCRFIRVLKISKNSWRFETVIPKKSQAVITFTDETGRQSK